MLTSSFLWPYHPLWQPLLGDLIQTENFSEIKPPLFNENWCDFLGAACMYSKQNIKIITHIPIFKWLSGQSRNRSIRGLWDCHNVWEPLRRGHQGPLERWWHHGMLWQTERISAYRFCQIVSVHFIIFSFLPRRHGELQTREQGQAPLKVRINLLNICKEGGHFSPKICYSNYISDSNPPFNVHTIYLMLSSLDVNIFICRRLQSSAKSTLPNFQKENT